MKRFLPRIREIRDILNPSSASSWIFGMNETPLKAKGELER